MTDGKGAHSPIGAAIFEMSDAYDAGVVSCETLRAFGHSGDDAAGCDPSKREPQTHSPVPSDAEIEEAVRAFRNAIDLAGQAPWEEKYIPFPRGACGHAAELLGRYLIDRFGISPQYVNQDARASIGGWEHSHAWLEWNGLTIDISGDQFGWPPVIVTRTPEFHGRGEENTRHPVCLPHQRDWWLQECGSLWMAIAPHLPAYC